MKTNHDDWRKVKPLNKRKGKKRVRRPGPIRTPPYKHAMDDDGICPFGIAISFREAKRVHAWLGRAIKYLEEK